jgi:AhpD family alkylhydroperoxidase
MPRQVAAQQQPVRRAHHVRHGEYRPFPQAAEILIQPGTRLILERQAQGMTWIKPASRRQMYASQKIGAAAMKDWPANVAELTSQLRTLRGGAPEVMKAFAGMAQAAVAPKALDSRTKELLALGIAVAIRCDDCIGFHVKAALQHGATREQVLETLGMAIYMGAGPSVMYATHALDAYAQFEAQKAGQAAS